MKKRNTEYFKIIKITIKKGEQSFKRLANNNMATGSTTHTTRSIIPIFLIVGIIIIGVIAVFKGHQTGSISIDQEPARSSNAIYGEQQESGGTSYSNKPSGSTGSGGSSSGTGGSSGASGGNVNIMDAYDELQRPVE